MRDGGYSAQSEIDTIDSRLSELRQQKSEKEQNLVKIRTRLNAQREGIHLDSEGDKLSLARTASDSLEVEIARSEMALRDAINSLQKAEEVYEAERRDFEKMRTAAIEIPAGAFVWRNFVRQHQFVKKGDPVISWIDCGEIYLDVSVSNAEAALIEIGSAAKIFIDGEKSARNGIVKHIRGSAARIPATELASRQNNSESAAQILVEIPDTDVKSEGCIVGKTAWVDFSQIGIVDIVRARLRL